MGEGVAVRSFFGEGARNGGNSSLVGELSVEEMEGEPYDRRDDEYYVS